MAFKGKWTVPMLRKIAQRYTTRGEFSRKASAAYRTTLRMEDARICGADTICEHMILGKFGAPRKELTREQVYERAACYWYMRGILENDSELYTAIKRLGMTEEVKAQLAENRRKARTSA